MSLLQLLTTGKSLVGLQDSEPRYRMTHERMFPQFGPARNPFCTSDKPDTTRAEASRRTEWVPTSSQPKADIRKLDIRISVASTIGNARNVVKLIHFIFFLFLFFVNNKRVRA